MKSRRLYLVLVGLLVYVGLYYLAPLSNLAVEGRAPSRGGFLLRSILLLDEVVRLWFGEPAEFALAERLPIALAAGGILIVSGLVGWIVLQGLRLTPQFTRPERFFFSLAVGLNLVSLHVLVLGLLGITFSRAAVLAPAELIFLWVLWRRRPCAPSPPSADACGADWLSPRWLWLAAPFVVLIALGGMTPPIEFDVREYHLQAPKEFFQQGRITFLPHNVYANMPLGAEMLALLGMIVTNDAWTGAMVGKTLIALFVPLTAIGLFAAGSRWFNRSAGVVAAVVYVSIPWMAMVSNLGLIDGVLAFYLFAAAYAVWLAWDSRTSTQATSFWLLAGFLAGAAAACKYTGVVFAVIPLGLWILRAGGKWNWKPALLYSLAVFAGCGLWYVKNAVLTGNPTYPLMAGIFGGETRTAERDAQWRAAHRPPTFAISAAASDFARLAWRGEGLSPLVLPLALLAWLLPCRRPAVRWLWLYVLWIVVVWWLATHRLDRFWLPLLPLLALLAGAGATWTDAVAWRRGFAAFMAIGLIACFLWIAQPMGGDVAYFVSYDRLRSDPQRVDRWHLYLNEHVPEGSQALLIGDAQVFDLKIPILYNTVFDENQLERLARGRTPAEIHAALQAAKISHLYVHWGEIARYRSPGNYGFTNFIQPRLFNKLVAAQVLKPLPPLENHPGQMFEVE